MPQDADSGRRANEFGNRMGKIIAAKIGAQPVGSDGNEYSWKERRITIRSAHRGTATVGALYEMLDRVDDVLAGIETTVPDSFQVYRIPRDLFLQNARQAPDERIALVSRKVFLDKGELIAKVSDTK